MTDYSKESKLKKQSKQGFDPRWQDLRDSFGVPRSNVFAASRYMTQHILEIATDALMGQCTKGHSCSDKAKAKLETVLVRYSELLAADNQTAVDK